MNIKSMKDDELARHFVEVAAELYGRGRIRQTVSFVMNTRSNGHLVTPQQRGAFAQIADAVDASDMENNYD